MASSDTIRVLFFGRSDCNATKKASDLLNRLGCKTTTVSSKGRGDKLPEDLSRWEGEFIFCFRSLFILPRDLLNKASIAAVNFHPAPVEYPGSGCLNFALYENATQYGVTAHVMNEKVDNGTILDCRRFPLLPTDTVDSLLKRTHLELLDLFCDTVTELVLGGKNALERKIRDSSSEQWRGNARKMKDLDKLQIVPIDATEDELTRIIRATYTEKFPPLIKLHGYEFVLKAPHKTS